MKPHAIFAAIALVLASLGATTMAVAQSTVPPEPPPIQPDNGSRLDEGERPQRQGKRGGLQALDSDGDGRLSRAEVAGKDRLAEQFASIDVNGDGDIERSELRAWHERTRPQREAERGQRVQAKFAEADLDRDGKLSRVEVDEKMPRLAQQFARMDGNGDGFLSREEMTSQGRR